MTKHRKILWFLVLFAIATWFACSVGPPVVRTVSGPLRGPEGAVEATGPEYEEGLVDVNALGPGGSPGQTVDAAAGPVVPANLPALPGAGERVAGVVALRQGLDLMGKGDALAASREFDRAGGLLVAFADWADLLAAKSFAAAGDVGEVRRRVERLGSTGAGEWAWRAHHDVLLAVGDSGTAITVAEEAARFAATAAERAFAWSRAGTLRAARQDTRGALEAFRRAMRESPSTPGGLAAARGAHDLPELTPEDRLLVGRTLLAHGGTDRGVPMLEAYASAPGTTEAQRTEVLLEVGTILFNARRYDPAERHLRAAAAHSPGAALLLARTQYRQGNQAQGVQSFLSVTRSYPSSGAAADALFLLGDLAHDAGRTPEAAEYYRQAIATGVHNASAVDAAVRLAGMSLITGNAQVARQDLERYLSGRPRDRTSAPAVYWLARAESALGDAQSAQVLFREVLELDAFSYYGMLAARRLGTSLAAIDLPDPPAISGSVALVVEFAFFRMDLLREIGLSDEADLEIARLQELFATDPAALYHVAEAMARHGQPVAGALLGRRIQLATGVWDDRLLRIVHQFPFGELVVRESRRQGLDPFAVAGLIRQESLFNPIAVSPAGAVGLMQVMPPTGAGLARRAGVANFQASMLRDPATNIRLGTLYLADQMSRWNGRLSDVLGAYNAGPNRVVRWRQFPEYRDDEIYVERIPLAETRDYVKRVTLYAEIYRRLYGS